MPTPEEQRFEQIYRDNFDRVAAYLRSRTDRGSAEEALARTFEVAWRRIGELPAQPLPWLLGVGRKVLAAQRRGDARRRALVERLAPTISDAEDDHAESLAARQRILVALGHLKETQREALLLVAWEGLTPEEAATVLGCSRGAVRVRLHRARARMRSAFLDAAPEDGTVTRSPPDLSCPKLHSPPSSPVIKETT